MLNTAHPPTDIATPRSAGRSAPGIAPWSLRSLHAWPPLLWQAGVPPRLPFQHRGTRIADPGSARLAPSGQTLWAAQADEGEAGMAWDWVQITHGVVAMADPMTVITNLRLVGRAGEVLTPQESVCFLNELVRMLPWQHEVQRVLGERNG